MCVSSLFSNLISFVFFYPFAFYVAINLSADFSIQHASYYLNTVGTSKKEKKKKKESQIIIFPQIKLLCYLLIYWTDNNNKNSKLKLDHRGDQTV